MWTSIGSHDCQGCEKCGTTFSSHPEGHRPLQPHKYKIMYDDHTGKPYKRCDLCGHTEKDEYLASHKDTPWTEEQIIMFAKSKGFVIKVEQQEESTKEEKGV